MAIVASTRAMGRCINMQQDAEGRNALVISSALSRDGLSSTCHESVDFRIIRLYA